MKKMTNLMLTDADPKISRFGQKLTNPTCLWYFTIRLQIPKGKMLVKFFFGVNSDFFILPKIRGHEKDDKSDADRRRPKNFTFRPKTDKSSLSVGFHHSTTDSQRQNASENFFLS
jgi:hypothetical protein